MKKTYLFFALLCAIFAMSAINAQAKVKIDETNFPDSAFRAYVSTTTCDADQDGYLDDEEIAQDTIMYLNNGGAGLGIKNLKGIEYFTKLQGVVLNNNPITDASTLKQCTLLTQVVAQYLPELTELDMSGHPSLMQITTKCDSALQRLDLSNCPALYQIITESDTSLTYLNLTGCTAMKKVNLYHNTNLPTITGISDCKNIVTFYAQSSGLTGHLDLSNNTSMTDLKINPAKLESIDLSNCTSLKQVYLGSNNLTSVNVTGCTAVTYFSAAANQLSEIDITPLRSTLVNLYLSGNNFTSLDLSNFPKLKIASVGGNPLTSLNLSGSTAITTLQAYKTNLETINTSEQTALTSLSAYDGVLSSLDLTNNTKLTTLTLRNNPNLSTLDLSKNTALTTLYIQRCNFSNIDLTNNTKLATFWAAGNKLSTIDLSKNTALKSLDLQTNFFEEIDLSANTALTKLGLHENLLRHIDLTNNTKITQLNLRKNQLVALDLSAQASLAKCYTDSCLRTVNDMELAVNENGDLMVVYNVANFDEADGFDIANMVDSADVYTVTGSDNSRLAEDGTTGGNYIIIAENPEDGVHEYTKAYRYKTGCSTLTFAKATFNLNGEVNVSGIDETTLPTIKKITDNNIYDLQGHIIKLNDTNVNDLPAGVYIVGGKVINKR